MEQVPGMDQKTKARYVAWLEGQGLDASYPQLSDIQQPSYPQAITSGTS